MKQISKDPDFQFYEVIHNLYLRSTVIDLDNASNSLITLLIAINISINSMFITAKKLNPAYQVAIRLTANYSWSCPSIVQPIKSIPFHCRSR